MLLFDKVCPEWLTRMYLYLFCCRLGKSELINITDSKRVSQYKCVYKSYDIFTYHTGELTLTTIALERE